MNQKSLPLFRNLTRYFKMSTAQESILNIQNIRDKPFIVICGCTGTGKTKLSIQLAEWLISMGKKAEIINADAMQVYNGKMFK